MPGILRMPGSSLFKADIQEVISCKLKIHARRRGSFQNISFILLRLFRQNQERS